VRAIDFVEEDEESGHAVALLLGMTLSILIPAG
jgi:hypothetical protein